MKRAKIIFNQTLMISTGILFGLGIQALINYLAGGKAEITWPWYIPLSVILTGFLCALATALLIDREGEVVAIRAVKGNYWDGQPLRGQPFEGVWLQLGAVKSPPPFANASLSYFS